MAWERRSETSSVPRKMTGRMWAIVEGKLDAVESRADIGTSRALVSVSAEWIYRHVWEDKRNGGDLFCGVGGRSATKYSGKTGPCRHRPGAAQEKGRWETGRRTRSSVLARSLIGPRSSRFFSLYGKEFGGSGKGGGEEAFALHGGCAYHL